MRRMRQIVALLLLVLCSAVLMCAQNSSNRITGTVCDSQCVTRSPNGDVACTADCTGGGTAVFVSDSGQLMQIENQDICKSHMGERVKMKYHMVSPATTDKEAVIQAEDFQHFTAAGG